ncbi:MAG TPA: T9SS type A sorting domain-containing protein [Ignavibacteria bacterium]|nr:T9SS type A sorting domain-containing protein [Ignavibacteria bacterium]
MKLVYTILIVLVVLISGSNAKAGNNKHFYNETDGIGAGYGDDFKLYQNFPNPFNPVTKINYKLNANGFVSLVVYNLIGQEVKVLVNDFQEAGTYAVTFDGSELTTGIYIYKLQMNGYTSVRRMTLVK